MINSCSDIKHNQCNLDGYEIFVSVNVCANQLLAFSIVCVSPRTKNWCNKCSNRTPHTRTLPTFNLMTNNICPTVIHLKFYQVHVEHWHIVIVLNADAKFRNILCVWIDGAWHQEQHCIISLMARTIIYTHTLEVRYSCVIDTLAIIVGAVRDFWFRFFQKHQIWHICCPNHTFSIFDGRQDGRPLGSPYWRNPIWPPPG